VTVCTGMLCVSVPLFLAGGLKFPEETKVVFDKKTSSFIRVPEATMTVARHRRRAAVLSFDGDGDDQRATSS
jgi:hypothetical protein